jgi:hypothetical protein
LLCKRRRLTLAGKLMSLVEKQDLLLTPSLIFAKPNHPIFAVPVS